MSDLVHLPSGAGDGSDNGFLSLARRVTTLAAAALMLKEGLFVLKARMERNSGTARRLSEMCGVAEVEPKYTAQILEVSGALQRVAQASGDLAATADDMQIKAQGFNSAHQSEYRGIYEAVNASGVRQAKPGFYRVR
ncbi:conjugal transfer protein TraB [Actinacidiphila paucisporea]|uniref:Conjugal transfer protein TraB n=1 Tax=Actinacidiphila paucisporea TaxID=310782 RepID=A0A1M7QT40_9ACTN|nr:conjugal transfer protein TraB [Actinacidiphila paucisporea]SHN34599.1 hypothetical protein SAMN05216499_14137 [Actinacidiphila paucisporea]